MRLAGRPARAAFADGNATPSNMARSTRGLPDPVRLVSLGQLHDVLAEHDQVGDCSGFDAAEPVVVPHQPGAPVSRLMPSFVQRTWELSRGQSPQ